MAAKLGLDELKGGEDDKLKSELWEILQLVETDMTIFYRRLADVPASSVAADGHDILSPVADAYYRPEQLDQDDNRNRIANWLRSYKQRVAATGVSDDQRREKMNRVNPKYVLRNYMAQLAIDKSEENDHSLIQELLDVLRKPYDEQPEHEPHAAKRPDWARDRAGCSMLSCSS